MELIVQIVDQVSDDPKKSQQRYKRGDVIEVKPDGWPWCRGELEHNEWRLLRVPDMSKAEAESLRVSEKPPVLTKQYVLRKRAFRIDMDALGIFYDPKVPRDDDALPKLSASQIIATKTGKGEPEELTIPIGPSSHTIGPK